MHEKSRSVPPPDHTWIPEERQAGEPRENTLPRSIRRFSHKCAPSTSWTGTRARMTRAVLDSGRLRRGSLGQAYSRAVPCLCLQRLRRISQPRTCFSESVRWPLRVRSGRQERMFLRLVTWLLFFIAFSQRAAGGDRASATGRARVSVPRAASQLGVRHGSRERVRHGVQSMCRQVRSVAAGRITINKATECCGRLTVRRSH